MAHQSPAAMAGTAPPPPAHRLEPDAIGVAQDTVIGMASSAPAATIGLSLLAVFGSTSTQPWAWIAIGTTVGVIMLVIAVVGIRITARTQVGIALVEYLILIGISIWGLVAVLNHHPGTFPITKGWFSP